VQYETTVAGPGGRPVVVRRKARLQALLGALSRVREGLAVTAVESKAEDPRKLLLATTKTLESHMRLVAEIAGKIAVQGSTTFLISPEWTALRGRMLLALAEYPQARLALAAALSEGDNALVA